MTTRTSGTRPREGIAKITIDRPEVRNAFRPLTVKELIRAFDVARDDPTIGVVVLTGEGPDAFCSGGDQKIRGDDGYVDEQGIGRLNVLDLQIQIRRMPKPVVAMVAGYAIGGGHVLHVCCDLTIAADNARFGQTGPRVGSFDGGYGISLLARQIGEKRAKEIWFLCRQYDAQTALAWGLVNAVVPLDELEPTTVAWCREMLGAVAARAPAAEGRCERGHGRPRGRAAARRRRHAPLLHERGGAGGARRVQGEARRPTSRGSRSARERPSRVCGGAARGRARSALGVVPVLVGVAAAGHVICVAVRSRRCSSRPACRSA